jgi:2-oxoglutarate ferredoxin oxidoreductase subunit beta
LHKGFAFIDVISPCVAFNNHQGSTKSYDYVRGHTESVTLADFIAPQQEITADYEPGSTEDVAMPDGSRLRLRKLDDSYDPRDRFAALAHVLERQAAGEVVTGLLYVDPNASDCHEIMNTIQKPLNTLGEKDLCPGNGALDRVNASYR